MTWQLGAFTVLAVALAGGFAWYERTRPDARILALVATLAAFAALGRIAFAALPNIKPTTDVVLVSGYALGAAPGFMVGALAGLTSNFFFGQGPWTPWQMAAWGATGALGAGLAVLTGKRVSRWPLALACALVGYAFTAVQDVGDWVTYSDHSLPQLGVYVGKGTGFDFVHAAGCLLFALAFGPWLATSIARCATRLQVTWRTLDGTVPPATLTLVLLVVGATVAAPPAARAAGTPADYLVAAQNSDGGFGAAAGSASSQLYSGWAALGLAAAGYDLQKVSHGGPSVIQYVAAGGGAMDTGSLERTILVLRSTGLPAGGLAAALQRDVRGDGSVSDQVNLTSFAVLALRAADIQPAPATLSWLVRQEDADGGFNFAAAPGTSDVDDTGAALEALAGVRSPAAAGDRDGAVRFIRAQQNRDGGFPANPGGDSNAQSTAWAVQGLVAAGVDPNSLHRGGAPSPLQYLRSLVAPDGHVSYSSGNDQTPVWVTGQALMALMERPLPFAPATHRKGSGTAAGRAPAGHAVHAAGGVQRRAGRPRPSHRVSGATTRTSAWAADLALATALVLAPVGTP